MQGHKTNSASAVAEGCFRRTILPSNPISIKEKTSMRVSAPFFTSSVSKSLFASLALLAALSFAAPPARAQSLGYEGPTGVFVTPLALVTASPVKGLGEPSAAYHFLAGGPIIGDFSTVSITEGFSSRVEFGYTHEIHSDDGGSQAPLHSALTPLWNSGFDIVHAKVNLIPDSYKKQKWIPAISVGGIFRSSDNIGTNINNLATALLINDKITPIAGTQKTANGDVYVVATKLFTQVKNLPILVSAGLRGTNASLWGLGGNSPGFEGKAFGSAAFVVKGPYKSTIIPAFEIAEQPQHISLATPTATLGSSKAATLFDIPTTEVYAVRIVPFAKRKLNVDAGVLHAGGYIDNALLNEVIADNFTGPTAGGKVNLNIRARVAFGISYGF
jgi:hypothetical protein